jgi:hypothetical protein
VSGVVCSGSPCFLPDHHTPSPGAVYATANHRTLDRPSRRDNILHPERKSDDCTGVQVFNCKLRRAVFLEKIFTHPVKKYPYFMEPEGSLPCPQRATVSYFRPYLSKNFSKYYPPTYACVFFIFILKYSQYIALGRPQVIFFPYSKRPGFGVGNANYKLDIFRNRNPDVFSL